MKYFSTRGADTFLSFEEAVITGLAPNGGLYIPQTIPTLPENWQEEWKSYAFNQLSHAILSLYISPSEIPSSDLKVLIDKSYAGFRHPEVAPTKKVETADGREVWVLELWHGPTFAFKDVALQLLGNLFEYFLKRKNARLEEEKGRALTEVEKNKITVIGATSGDTGSAAIYGLRGKENVSIFILHPKGRVSPIQEAQMTTITDANVHNVAVKGTFDDCQDIVKALFSDAAFNATHKLGAINSINWARILAQTVYYFLSYFYVLRQTPQTANTRHHSCPQFVVPTGNFGDVLAGFYAKRMGLPMAQLGVGTNENDILARFWKTGRYEKVASVGEGEAVGATQPVLGSSDGQQAVAGVKATHSPAMDILISSNFERLLWYLAFDATSKDRDDDARRNEACSVVDRWMKTMKSDGKVTLPVEVLEFARKDFVAERVSDEQTLETIKAFYRDCSPPYIVDPHTAVGLAAASRFHKKPRSYTTQHHPQVVLSTAHPAKFSEAVTLALSGQATFDFEKDVMPNEFKGLLEKERKVIDVERPDVELVKKVIEDVAEETRVKARGVGGAAALGSV
ncbi:threonine synthase [Tulasnella sp. JGI-2019a]|nr:threonine synthase [Tulasnella sp. JGI-2019a]KAG9008167.1 threonine synthase [Tulasnella sp. JGI-2019a]